MAVREAASGPSVATTPSAQRPATAWYARRARANSDAVMRALAGIKGLRELLIGWMCMLEVHEAGCS